MRCRTCGGKEFETAELELEKTSLASLARVLGTGKVLSVAQRRQCDEVAAW